MAAASRKQRLGEIFRDDAKPATTQIPLQDGERIVEHLFAKTPETGGELALTDRRLIFAPWRFTALKEMLTAGFLPVAPDPSLPEAVQERQLLSGTVMIANDRIEAAAAGRKAAHYRPPGLRITTSAGSVEFGILAGPYKRNKAPANTRARDAFVSALNAVLGTAS